MHIIETRQAPNPRRVRIFLAEKGIDVAFEERSLMEGALKEPDVTKLNPWQRVPILVFDEGSSLSETMAICRYFEAVSPEPALFGRNAREIGDIEMWQRRVELGLFAGIAHSFRHLNEKMANLELPQIAAWGHANKDKVAAELRLLDASLEQRAFIAGDHYSVADITLLVALDFMKPARLERNADLRHIERWYQAVSTRPSALA